MQVLSSKFNNWFSSHFIIIISQTTIILNNDYWQVLWCIHGGIPEAVLIFQGIYWMQVAECKLAL